MNLLTDLYRNKAKDLQEKLNVLEKELTILDESIVSSTGEMLTDPMTIGTVGGLILLDKATKKFQPNYPTPTSFIGHAQHEFTSFPVSRGVIGAGKAAAKGVATAVTKPVETARNIATAAQTTANSMGKATTSPAQVARTAATATRTVGTLGLGIAAPLAAGHITGELVSKGGELTGIEALKPSEPGDVPSTGDVASSAADWAAMTATGTVLSNLIAGEALGSGVAAAAGLGAIGGALAPFAVYGGLKGAEAIRNIKMDDETTFGDWYDEKISNLVRTYYGAEDVYAEPPSVVIRKANKMRNTPYKSKTEKEIEETGSKPLELPQF